MANDSLKNAAYSLVATAPSPASSGTSLVLTAGEGDRFPSSGSFDVVIWKSGESPAWAAGAATGGNFEICRATRSGDTLTLTRAQYGTSARTVVVGDQVAQNVTANMVQQAATSYGLQFFGDGSDGDVTISSTVTLTRDMMYNNLTIASGAALVASGRISVLGTLDLTNAPASGIQVKGNTANTPSGTNESTRGAANGASSQAYANCTIYSQASAGSSNNDGSTAVNSNTNPGLPAAQGVGPTQRTGYGGGGGTSPSGGTSVVGAAATLNPQPVIGPKWYFGSIVGNALSTLGATTQPNGQRGSGDGTNKGGAGGSSGGSGGLIWLAAKTIARGSSTAAGCIDASGAAGGRGGSPTTGNCGGGGGGGAGVGGYVHIIYQSITGTAVSNAIYANGADGGAGGTGCGTGTNGTGGGGSDGGIIDVFDIASATRTKTTGTAGGAHSGTTGGTGGTCQADL